MMEYIDMVVTYVYDALESFFNDLKKPTNKYIKESLIVSLIFLGFSMLTFFTKVPSFVSPIEAGATTFILGVVYFIDSSNRSKAKMKVLELKRNIKPESSNQDIEEVQEELIDDE